MTDILSSHASWSRSPMPGVSQQQQEQQNYQKNTHRVLPRLKNDLSPQTTPRTVTLFRNGDRYFAGKQAAIIPQNYSNLGQLLQELSTTITLPYGVRRLFTPNKGSEVTDVNIIKDGASYVCASFEPFQRLEYTAITVPRLTFNIEQCKFFIVYSLLFKNLFLIYQVYRILFPFSTPSDSISYSSNYILTKTCLFLSISLSLKPMLVSLTIFIKYT